MVKTSLVFASVASSVRFSSAFVPSTGGVSQTEWNTHQTKHAPIGAVHMATSLSEQDEAAVVMPRTRAPETSQALPFLARPAALKGELAGDVGFDPLGLAKNEESLYAYREAEIKHARLAMLAAAGWPLSELFDKKIAAAFHLPPILEVGNRVPSVLNGGLDRVPPAWWGFCLGMAAAIDLYGVSRARAFASGENMDYIPGDLNFDPLGLYPPPSDKEGRKRMELAEIKHGRVAMLAVTGYAFQEAASGIGVVDETPLFFLPITMTLFTNPLLGFSALGFTKALLDSFVENFDTYSFL